MLDTIISADCSCFHRHLYHFILLQKQYIKHINKTDEQANKALIDNSDLTAALNIVNSNPLQ